MNCGIKTGILAAALLLGVGSGKIAVSAESSEQDWQSQYTNLMLNITSYYEEETSLCGYLADLNNDGTPELVVLEDIGGGIMLANPRVYYLTEDGVQYAEVEGEEGQDAYYAGVYCDASSGAEVFLLDAACLEWSAPGEQITEMTGRDCRKIMFDGYSAWSVLVEGFSGYIGETYSEEIYDRYQTFSVNFRMSDTSGRQILTENPQLGFIPDGSQFVDFISSYRYCGNMGGSGEESKICELLNLLGKDVGEVETYFGCGCVYEERSWKEYEIDLYGTMGTALCDFADGMLQTFTWEGTGNVEELYNQQFLEQMIGELDQLMTMKSATEETEELPGEYVWEGNGQQARLSFKRAEEWEMVSLQLYRTVAMAESNVVSEDWRSAYKSFLYPTKKSLEQEDNPDGWSVQLMDLDEDGIPELVATAVRGARGLSKEVRVFAYRDYSVEEIPVEDHCSFSRIGRFRGYRNADTGELQWLMNLSSFTDGGLAPGGYLDSTAGQGGVAELELSGDGTYAMLNEVVDVETDWGIVPRFGVEACDEELWQEDCITEEIWNRIQQMADSYQLEIESPDIYLSAYDSGPDRNEEIADEVEALLAEF